MKKVIKNGGDKEEKLSGPSNPNHQKPGDKPRSPKGGNKNRDRRGQGI